MRILLLKLLPQVTVLILQKRLVPVIVLKARASRVPMLSMQSSPDARTFKTMRKMFLPLLSTPLLMCDLSILLSRHSMKPLNLRILCWDCVGLQAALEALKARRKTSQLKNYCPLILRDGPVDLIQGRLGVIQRSRQVRGTVVKIVPNLGTMRGPVPTLPCIRGLQELSIDW